MKIKDKLIHLLGGFTNDDRHVWATSTVKLAYVQRSVRTLKTMCCISDPRHQPPDDFLQHELMARLANTILEEKLVSFYTKPRYPGESDYPQDVYAMIKVVEPTDEGKAYGMQRL